MIDVQRVYNPTSQQACNTGKRAQRYVLCIAFCLRTHVLANFKFGALEMSCVTNIYNCCIYYCHCYQYMNIYRY